MCLCMPWYFSLNGHQSVFICSYYSELETAEYINLKSTILHCIDQDTSNLLSSDIKNTIPDNFVFLNVNHRKNRISTGKIDIQTFCIEMNKVDRAFFSDCLFISNSDFIAKMDLTIRDFIVEYDYIPFDSPESFLIIYLELNGITVNHNQTNETDCSYNKNLFIDSASLLKLQVFNGLKSLFNVVNKTNTTEGKKEFARMFIEPKSMLEIKTWFETLAVMRNNQFIIKISEAIRKFRSVEYFNQNTAVVNENKASSMTYDLNTSFIFDGMVSHSKSIYSKKDLDEKSILGYRRILRTVSNIRSNIKIIYEMKKLIKMANLEIIHNPFEKFMNLCKTYDQTVSSKIKEIMSKMDEDSVFSKWLLVDKYAFIVKTGVDPYLDLCRKCYEEKIAECQAFLFDITKDTDLRVFLSDNGEICLIKKSGKNQTEYGNESNSTTKYKKRILVMKECKTATLYTCVELKAINKVLKDALDQMIEIEGRICKSILIDLKKSSEIFVEFTRVICEIDVLMCCAMLSRDFSYKKPVISDSVFIQNASDCIYSNFRRVSYEFDSDKVYVITGANMAGKSCYVKNFARISILVRVGLFIDCEHIDIPLYDEIFMIESINDLNNLITSILDRNLNLKYAYKTPKRLIIIDELHCCVNIQLSLLRILKKCKILTLFVSHNTKLIKELDKDGFDVYRFEDYRMIKGLNKNSTVIKICERFFPEIVEKLNEKLKINC